MMASGLSGNHQTPENGLQVEEEDDGITVSECLKDPMAWLVWIMAVFSVSKYHSF